MTFKAGESGNPTGRPKGIIDKRTEWRELLQSHAKDLIKTLVDEAKAGDSTALRLCIERLLPRSKADNSIHFELPEGRLDSGDNMLQIAHDITAAVASGQLSIEEAEKFAAFIDRQRNVIKNAEWQQRNEIADAESKKYWDERLKKTDRVSG